MSACTLPSPDTPAIRLTLAGGGESLLRLESVCTARLLLEIRKDPEALGIPYDQTPAILREGTVCLNGLPRTEEIEVWLRLNFTSGNTWSSPER